ncbi:MAG: AAA family ATPase [Lachnospiraceae bacterium]
MTTDYVKNTNRLINQYTWLISQAESTRAANNDVPSAEEGRLYQQAAEVCGKIASNSIDAMKNRWEQNQKDCTAKLREIALYLNPAAVKKMESQKKNLADTKKSDTQVKKGEENQENSSEDEVVTEEMVQSWFQDPPKHGFDKVAGMDELKKYLKECVKNSTFTALNQYMDMENVNSFFLYGLFGCGKTYIAKALAHELMKTGYKYMSLSGADILSRYVGDANKIIQRVFVEAEKNAPCILFIDELDGVCKNRDQPNLAGHEYSLITTFLDGFNHIYEQDKPIVFIAATNYPNRVDGAMMDRLELIRVPLPDLKARTHAFEMKLEFITKEDGFTCEDMAAQTDDYSYRDINRIVAKLKRIIKKQGANAYESEEELLEALKRGEFCLTREMFMQAKNDCRPTPKAEMKASIEKWEKEVSEKEIRED